MATKRVSNSVKVTACEVCGASFGTNAKGGLKRRSLPFSQGVGKPPISRYVCLSCWRRLTDGWVPRNA